MKKILVAVCVSLAVAFAGVAMAANTKAAPKADANKVQTAPTTSAPSLADENEATLSTPSKDATLIAKKKKGKKAEVAPAPAAKEEKKAGPKVEKKAEPKVEKKTEPKTEKKAEPKTEKKSEPAKK